LIKADFLLPHDFKKESREFSQIIKMLLFLVDNIATSFRLSGPARIKAEKERAVLE